MKTYILTAKERELIDEYMRTDRKSSQLRTLKMRMLENYRTLEEDLRLIAKYLMVTGVYVSDEYTPVEVLEERRLDQEALERNPMWRVYYIGDDGKKYYTLIQASAEEEARQKFTKQRKGKYESMEVQQL